VDKSSPRDENKVLNENPHYWAENGEVRLSKELATNYLALSGDNKNKVSRCVSGRSIGKCKNKVHLNIKTPPTEKMMT
jgi:hypothetical protein